MKLKKGDEITNRLVSDMRNAPGIFSALLNLSSPTLSLSLDFKTISLKIAKLFSISIYFLSIYSPPRIALNG